MQDKYIREYITNIKENIFDDYKLEKIINQIYEDGFQDGVNSVEDK